MTGPEEIGPQIASGEVWDVRKEFLTERHWNSSFVRHWNRAGVESPALGGSQTVWMWHLGTPGIRLCSQGTGTRGGDTGRCWRCCEVRERQEMRPGSFWGGGGSSPRPAGLGEVREVMELSEEKPRRLFPAPAFPFGISGTPSWTRRAGMTSGF